MEGTIKVLKEGFGFITSEETPNDVFFHAGGITDKDFKELRVGDTLSFEIWDGNNGKKQAVNIVCK